ncbi:hypothetical protein HSUHS5_0121 [Helicobacter suis HS5]|uniref:Uncharacterized protein n=1 Tax=Helicobacter suis HS5 TaxID=710394 RepID=E7G2I7_9HELI|nr:hypothetical protein HSUHS5_0121 [Helicobacter suis HS5]EFX43500.1 hypothetical protein HSUHS1_0197 [Helicobacter suis HS1]
MPPTRRNSCRNPVQPHIQKDTA